MSVSYSICMLICRGFCLYFFFFSSRRRHTRLQGDWSSDVCSSDLAHDVGDLLGVAVREVEGADDQVLVVAARLRVVGNNDDGVLVEHLVEVIGGLDRKSTRLNSSHLVISYAVFCLKKKKVQRDCHD